MDLPGNPSSSVGIRLNTMRGWASRLPYPDAGKGGRSAEAGPFERIAQGEAISNLVPRSMFGTPMFFQCEIGGLMLPNTPLITVDVQKRLINTAVAGGDNSVKEIIGLDDYRITVQGYAINEAAASPEQRDHIGGGLTVPQEYPADWVRDLDRLIKRKDSLPVRCELLSYFQITNLVIESMKFGTEPGAQAYVPYMITALSDVPMKLILDQVEKEAGK